MIFLYILELLLACELLLLVGCIVTESLSYVRFEAGRGFQRFLKINRMIFAKLWYQPSASKESPVHQQKQPSADMPPQSSTVVVKKADLTEKSYSEIEINDRVRTFSGYGTAVLQFTNSGWNDLKSLYAQLDKEFDENLLTQDLSHHLRMGAWCRYFDHNRQGEEGHFLHFLIGRFIFMTVFKEEAEKNAPNNAMTMKKNKFLVTSTKHARTRLANREVNDFIDNGVFVKCDWQVFKPNVMGDRRQEWDSHYGLQIINAVIEKQNNYHILQNAKKEHKSYPTLEAWKEFIDLSQRVEKETVVNTECTYKGLKPSPDYAVEGNVFRFYLNDGKLDFKPKEMVSVHNYYEKEKILFKGTIREINEGFIDIRIMTHYDVSRLPQKGIIRSQFNNRSHQIQMEAIEKITSNNQRLAELLENPALALPPIEEKIAIKNSYIRESAAQQTAVRKAAGSSELFLIQGPPGTGKTSVITELIEQFVNKGQKVLVASQTNLAVDNVFEKIGNNESITSIRCGKEERMLDSVLPFKLENRAASMQKDIVHHIRSQKERYITLKDKIFTYKSELQELEAKYALLESEQNKMNQLEMQKSSYMIDAKVPSNKRYKQLVKKSNKLGKEISSNQLRTDKILQKTKYYLALPGSRGLILNLYVKVLQSSADRLTRIREKKVNRREQVYSLMENCEKSINEEVIQDRYYQQITNQIVLCQDKMNSEKHKLEEAIKQLPNEFSGVFNSEMSSGDVSRIIREYFELNETMYNRMKVMDEWAEYIKTDEESLHSLLLENVEVVGATCIGLETDPNLDGIQFDVAIIDESSRATVSETLVPMSRADKTILVGDHKQLPPTIKHELAAACEQQELDLPYKQSLFEQLIGKVNEDNRSMLTHQFRMHPDISEFISRAFYSGEYKAGKGTEDKVFPSAFFKKPLCFVDTRNFDTKGERKIQRGGYDNPLEADFVIKSLKQIIKDFQEQREKKRLEIGIIAPYKKQKQLILSKISELESFDNHLIDIEVETLDAFQGREKDIMIYSFTRSNPSGALGFTSELYRLNVGLSRARQLLILIGDSQTLSKARDEKINPILKSLLAYILESGSFKVLWLED